MKLSLIDTIGKRPYIPSLRVTLLAVAAFIFFVGINILFRGSQISQVVLLLAKVAVRLIPPFIWLAGGAIVAIWLVVLGKLW